MARAKTGITDDDDDDDDDERPSRRDPRVDAYIADAAPFARPILSHLQHVVHASCPDAAEALKWKMPFFVVDGRNVCFMAAFKAHCTFGFWRAKEIPDLPGRDEHARNGSMQRILSLDDLPSRRTLTSLVKAAAKLEATVPRPVRATDRRPEPKTPDDFGRALAARAGATDAFARMSPSGRREYVDWIVEAKRAATRTSRIAQAVEWIAEGKSRNWKYETC